MKRNICIIGIILAVMFISFAAWTMNLYGAFRHSPEVTIYPENKYNETLYAVTDMDYEPFSYINESGSYMGMDVELIAEIANRLHMNLDLRLMDWTEANNLVRSGQADVILNKETDFLFQDKDTIFTIPTIEKQYVVYGHEKISSVPELYGRRVASLHELYELGLGTGITYIDSYAKIFEAMKRGEYDFAVCPIQVGNVFLEKLDIRDVKPSYAVGHVYGAIAMSAEKEGLKQRINAIIKDLQSEGVLDSLERKWVSYRYYNLTVREILEAHPGLLMFFAVIVISIIFLSAFMAIQRRHLQEKDEYSRKLLIAKEKAEESNKAKSVFLSTMSHEIRTPINAVLGMNEMIIRSADDDGPEVLTQIKNYAGNVERAGKNLLSIINDILDFSKIDAGKMEIVPANYKLSSLLNDAANMIMFRTREKGLAFNIDVDEDLPDELFGDEVRVRQTLINVLSNAVKYTSAGSVSLSVNGERISQSELRLIFKISDTGIGIKPEDMAKLFAKFERVDLNRNKTIEGTGLGLAITRSLLLLMNGDIQVQSEYGKGSVFTITLPQKIISDDKIGDFRQKFDKAMQEKAAYHESFIAPDAKILIVDDTEMNLTVARGLLEKTEIQIDTANSGSAALNMTRQAKYDLILMDQMMPIMSGTETLENIKAQADGLNTKTPVICLTADAIIGAREKYLQEGFVDYLSKPIEGVYLERMLVKYLPAEKVIAKQVSTQEVKEHEPSELEKFYAENPELNFSEAVKVCASEELLAKTLKQFYVSSEDNINEIANFFTNKDYRNYTIKVHALKSSARLIGALSLSKEAMYLEECGNDSNVDEIERLTPGLLDSYRKLRAVIAGLYEKDSDSDKQEMSIDDLHELYMLIKQSAEEFDIDAIDELIEQASQYKIPESESAKFIRITKAANNVNWSDLDEALK